MKKTLACSMALCAATPALAGWRGIAWGTPRLEVATTLYPAAPAVSDGSTLLGTSLMLGNEGAVRDGAFEFSARYYYETDHLLLVRLTLAGTKDCEAYRVSLTATLGRPYRDSSGDTFDLTWRDQQRANLIRYRQYDTGICFADYTPLPPL